jgi:3-oxoacyl-[acyl-carrier-protein] synthase III
MSACTVSSVALRGIATTVPPQSEVTRTSSGRFGAEEVAKIATSTGIEARVVADASCCASDLCHAAAERLLTELGWDRSTISALVFVSQTPDYILPATSCLLQHRLSLPTTCAAFDVNLGCSGYVYGLWIAASLVAAGQRRVLLLVGDTINKLVSPADRATALLFGDAGSATALEADPQAGPMHFVLGTNGAGGRHLMVPAGGARQPHTADTGVRTARENGNIRSDDDLFMAGAEIFAFTLKEVPPLIDQALAAAGWTPDEVDHIVFHQANRFMLKHLARKMKLDEAKVTIALEHFGNTVSGSIPLAISSALRAEVRKKFLLAGFGVGYSWAALAFAPDPFLIIPPFVLGQ